VLAEKVNLTMKPPTFSAQLSVVFLRLVDDRYLVVNEEDIELQRRGNIPALKISSACNIPQRYLLLGSQSTECHMAGNKVM